jgi:hypothetical protein
MITRGGAVRSINTSTAGGTETKTIVLTSDVPADGTIYLGIMNRTNETATISSIADPVNGTWSTHQISGPTDSAGSTFRTWFVVLPVSAALTGAGNRTISVTTDVAVSLQMVAMWESSDQGAMTFQEFSTPQNTSSNTVDYDTVAISATGAGSLVAFLSVANGQASAPTVDLGETAVNETTGSDAGSFRTTLFSETISSASSVQVNCTIPTTSVGTFTGAVMLEGGGGAPAPSITDVDEDNIVLADQTNVSLDGTNFDTATVDIEQGSTIVAQSIDSQSATEIIFDVVFDAGVGPHLKHGSATVRVTNDDAQDDTNAITIEPEAGTDYVNVGTPNADPDLRLEAVPDAASGDQVQWGNVVGGGDETDVVVNADLTWDVTEGLVTAFDARCWDATNSTWGDWATQTVEAGETPGEPSTRRLRKPRFFRLLRGLF